MFERISGVALRASESGRLEWSLEVLRIFFEKDGGLFV